jgi:hypothetical protein
MVGLVHARVNDQENGKKGKFMRLRASKFVYLPIGGALAAGLLTSAIVLPQAKLAASQDCYGVCASATSLSLSRSSVAENTERLEEFSVRVSAGAGRTGVPTGSVAVELGDHTVCRIHLNDAGEGACGLASDQLAPGSYELAAHYSGDSNFIPSTSREEHLSVLALSGTELSLSRASVPVTREGMEQFSVKAFEDGRPGVRPTGSVKVVTDGRTLCSTGLSGGQGVCSLKGYELAAGRYEIQAEYSGNSTINPSTSNQKVLLTVRG